MTVARGLTAAVLAALASDAALACSGPGMAERLAETEWLVGFLMWATVGLMLGTALLTGIVGARWKLAPLFLAPLAVHPGWWVSVRRGDCGRLAEILAWSGLVVGAVALLGALAFAIRERRRQLT